MSTLLWACLIALVCLPVIAYVLYVFVGVAMYLIPRYVRYRILHWRLLSLGTLSQHHKIPKTIEQALMLYSTLSVTYGRSTGSIYRVTQYTKVFTFWMTLSERKRLNEEITRLSKTIPVMRYLT